MTDKRTRDYERLERAALDQLRLRGAGWVTAKELSMELGHGYQGIARALLRLSRKGSVVVQETTWVSNKFRVRTCNVYRLAPEIKATYPAWLMPTAPVVVSGTGRVVAFK